MQTVVTQLPCFWGQVGIRPGCEKISLGGVLPGEYYTIIWKQGERKIDVIESLYKTYFAGKVTTLQRIDEKHPDWLLHPLTGFSDETAEWLKMSDREVRVRRSMRDHVKATVLCPSEASFYEGCHWQLYDANNQWRGYLFQKVKTDAVTEFIYVSRYRHDRFQREVRKLMHHVFSEVKYFLNTS